MQKLSFCSVEKSDLPKTPGLLSSYSLPSTSFNLVVSNVDNGVRYTVEFCRWSTLFEKDTSHTVCINSGMRTYVVVLAVDTTLGQLTVSSSLYLHTIMS